MSNNIKKVLIVGTGEIAAEYCKILISMNVIPDVVGRNEEKARSFGEKYHVQAVGGGIDDYLKRTCKIYDYAIVASDILNLCANTCSLLESGVNNILTEKPAGMDRDDMKKICQLAERKHANVYVAYNRRFYASTAKAMDIIYEDGGVKSFYFEFTEWSHIVESLPIPETVKAQWFLANSTHVVDLAFFLGGEPKELSSFVSGELKWHKKGCVYAGAGVSSANALFTYQANWASPGRWGVEILTNKHRLYFRPMENLYIQELGSVSMKQLDIDDSLDKAYKPGFYKEVESFINGIDDGKKKTIQEQLRYMTYFEQIESRGRMNNNCK